ncbi:hypothetical protein ACTGJ9_037015 [Bradyrhizobium sp. RDM12]
MRALEYDEEAVAGDIIDAPSNTSDFRLHNVETDFELARRPLGVVLHQARIGSHVGMDYGEQEMFAEWPMLRRRIVVHVEQFEPKLHALGELNSIAIA